MTCPSAFRKALINEAIPSGAPSAFTRHANVGPTSLETQLKARRFRE